LKKLRDGREDAMEETIKQVLAETIEDDSAMAEWTAETDLINGIGLDSLQLVRFLMKLEDRLGISIDYDALQFEDLSSIGSLAKFLENSNA
jgi:acyl carrier protein